MSDFLAKYRPKTVKQVECPGLEDPIYVRVLSQREQGEFEVNFKRLTEAKDPTLAPYIFVTFACDAGGARLCTDSQIDEVQELDWRLVNAVVKAGFELNETSFGPALDDAKND